MQLLSDWFARPRYDQPKSHRSGNLNQGLTWDVGGTSISFQFKKMNGASTLIYTGSEGK